jgi:hypothetical protein
MESALQPSTDGKKNLLQLVESLKVFAGRWGT